MTQQKFEERLTTPNPKKRHPILKVVGMAAAALALFGVGAVATTSNTEPVTVTKEVKVPGPTVTKEVKVPGPVQRVEVPGPTVTKEVSNPACIAALTAADAVLTTNSQAFIIASEMVQATGVGDYEKLDSLTTVLETLRTQTLGPQVLEYNRLEQECVDAK